MENQHPNNRFLVSPAGKNEVQHLEAEKSYRLPQKERLIIYWHHLPATRQIQYYQHPLNQDLDLFLEDMLNKEKLRDHCCCILHFSDLH